jgi:hypothetical protein
MEKQYYNVEYVIENLAGSDLKNLDVKKVKYKLNSLYVDREFHGIDLDLQKYTSVFLLPLPKLFISTSDIPREIVASGYEYRLSHKFEYDFPDIYEPLYKIFHASARLSHMMLQLVLKFIPFNKGKLHFMKDLCGFSCIYLSLILDKVFKSEKAFFSMKKENNSIVYIPSQNIEQKDIIPLIDIGASIANVFIADWKNKQTLVEMLNEFEDTIQLLLTEKLKDERSKFYLLKLYEKYNEMLES